MAMTARPQTEPRYGGDSRAAPRKRRLLAACTAVGLLLGVGIGTLRSPSYSARADLYVGKTLSMTNTAALPGLAQGATDIASAYSQLIRNHTVLGDAARLLHSRHGLPGTLSASQIPQSPEIIVLAKASTKAKTVALANAGSQALVDQVAELNATARAELTGLLQRYQQLEESISQEDQTIQSLTGQIAGLQSKTPASSNVAALQAVLSTVEAQQNSDTLQASAIQSRYQSSIASLPGEEQILTRVGAATAQGSDRGKAIELGGAIGVTTGLLLGIAGLYLIQMRPGRRAARPARLLLPEEQ